MSRLYKNASSSTLTVGLAADAGTMPMTVADTSAYPLTSAPDSFYLWLSASGQAAGGAFEIVLVTGNAATPGAGAMTVVRGQDGTIPQVWAIGTVAERVVVAKEYGEFVAEADDLVALQGNLTVAGTVEFAQGIASLGTALAVPAGGTGQATLTQNALIIGQGTDAVAFSVPDTAGNLIQAEGGAWVQKTPNQVVTKAVIDNALNAVPLGVAEGGTGAQTLAAGELVVANGTGAFTTTPISTVNPLTTTKWLRKTQFFTTAGSGFTYTPANGSYVLAYIHGAGGGGGYLSNFPAQEGDGGDGGNGGFSFWSFPSDGTELTIVVGAAGTASTGDGADDATAGGLSGVYGDAVSKEAPGGGRGRDKLSGAGGADGADGAGTNTFTSLPTNGLTAPPVPRNTTRKDGTSHPGQLPAANSGGGGSGGAGGIYSPSTPPADGEPGWVVLQEYY